MLESGQYPPNSYYPPQRSGVKDFFLMLFASMTGFILANLALVFVVGGIFFLIIGALAGSETVTVEKGSILKISMKQEIIDSPRDEEDPFAAIFQEEGGGKKSLQQYVNAINKAGDDENITAIFLDISDPQSNLVILEEIRNALQGFKKKGKKIIAFSDFYSLRGMYIASVADKIWLNPRGNIMFKGLAAETPMFSDLLRSIGVEPQVIRVGKYKSAVEPFVMQNMSQDNKEQLKAYIGGLWSSVITKMSEKTKLDPARLNSIADSLSAYDPSLALKYGLVDGLVYHHQIDSLLMKEFKQTGKPKYLAFDKYLKTGAGNFSYETSDEVRIIYAQGDIITGKSTEESVGSETFVKAVKEAMEDASVKAVVLRIDSPGGSALASDIMYRQLELLKAKKPLIVSQGNYAASGGYYISSPADVIVSAPNTLTGSIGVFGLVLNTQKLMRDKLGVNFDTVKTNRYADFFTGVRPMSAYELSVMQMSVDTTYDTFISLVAKDRKIKKDQVHDIAQGRIWFAPDAKKNGLVDTLGGLYDAIKIAAGKAKMKSYSVTYSSTSESFFKKLMRNLESGIGVLLFGKETAKMVDPFVKEVERVSRFNGVMTVMPFNPVLF